MSGATHVTVRVPLTMRHRPGRKTVVTPVPTSTAAVHATRADPILVKALARVARYKRLLDEGRYASTSGMAAADRIDRGDLGRILRLTPPAPVRALRSAVHWFNLGTRVRTLSFPARKAVAHRRPIPRAPESLL